MDLHLSEVHVGRCPPGTGIWTSSIRLYPQNLASGEVQMDEDGDLSIERRIWKIRHLRETTLDAVGGQIWRGSCLLSDFILSSPELFRGKKALELGCGVGLVGIALHNIAQTVFLTDHCVEALQLCQENVCQNAASSDVFKIRMLDWNDLNEVLTAQSDGCNAEAAPFQWCAEDREVLKSVDVFFAADVIYDRPLTEAFFQTLAQLMHFSQNCPICYLSLEKRFNFTLEHLDVAAPAYEHFLSFINMQDDKKAQNEFTGEKLSLESIPQTSREVKTWSSGKFS